MKHILFILLSALCLSEVSMSQPVARFSHFKYVGNDDVFFQSIDSSRQYFNPVLAGYYPDPSVCRKDGDYYLVNSSFAYYPGVPLFHSRDLVHWEQLGHILDRPSQLPLEGQGVSGGIFAPDISYNEHNGTFYMVTTNVGKGNFVVKAKDPAGAWSDPVYLPNVNGIDPSLFFDNDGKAYLVHNAPVKGTPRYEGERAIRLFRYDVEGDSTIGEPVEIIRGGSHVDEQPIWIEGPHLYHIGKYYYLMCAEGGTGYRHSEVVFRAKSPFGPWEECPFNPILTQRDLPHTTYEVTTTGHADLLMKEDGTWWAVFLGCRPYEGDCYNTGRETFLLPVTWRDGWPVILGKGERVSNVVDYGHPDLVAKGAKKKSKRTSSNATLLEKPLSFSGNFTFEDNFTTSKLGERWIFLRNPSNFYSVGNGLELRPLYVSISDAESPSAIFFRQQHATFSVQTTMDFYPETEKELAGLVLFQNEKYNFVFGKTKRDNDVVVTLTRAEQTEVLIASACLDAEQAKASLSLKVDCHGRYADFFYSTNYGASWQLLARGVDTVNLSTNRAGGFVGTVIGLYATVGLH